VKAKNIAIGFNILALIPALVKLAEVFHGGGNGADKKAAVIGVATSLITAGGAAAATNNPAYADAISQVVDATVETLNGSGQMPTPAPAAAPVG